MNTYQTTAHLDIGGFQSPIPIQVDYVLYHSFSHKPNYGSLKLVPDEVRKIEIHAVSAFLGGVEVGIAKILTPEQYGVLEDKIEASLESETI